MCIYAKMENVLFICARVCVYRDEYAITNEVVLFDFADYVSGGELFTHLYQRERFTENQVRIYIGEIVLALEHLHKVKPVLIFLCSS